jgi:serine phosphatase RsbU (regulator of sigma subunit)
MGLDRSTMALSLLRLTPDGRDWTATLAAAGMPPAYHYRAADGSVEEIALPGMPLGGIQGFPYRRVERSLAPGDALLLMSDGFAEAGDEAGQPLGYAAAAEHFRNAAHEAATRRQEGQDEARGAQEILQALVRATESWTGGGALRDDVTFVVIRRVAMIAR